MTKNEFLIYILGLSSFICFLAVYCIAIDEPEVKHPMDKGPVD